MARILKISQITNSNIFSQVSCYFQMDELFSIEVFVRKIYSIDVDCYLPSLSFRLLDFPTQTINITDPERIVKIQDKIRENPNYVKDLSKLKNSKGDIVFNKGKSCLFPLSFESAQAQLSEIPLYVVLTDNVEKSPKFLGSIGISLVKIMDKLKEEIARDPKTICNDSLRGSYPIKNLMGTRIAKLAVEVKLYFYGSNLVNHIPALNNVADKKHSTSLGSSEHLVSNEAISSVMEEVSRNTEPDLINKTSDLFSPEESDSDKERDESESNLNPPPLFYQATPTQKLNKSKTKLRDEKDLVDKQYSQPGNSIPPHSKLDDNDIESVTRLEKLIKFGRNGQQLSPYPESSNLMELNEMMDRAYDPKRFDLIRAVLTELTYLTDFLDPNLEVEEKPETPENPLPKQNRNSRNQRPISQPKPVSTKIPKSKTPARYGLTNSYILRLSRLGPEKALDVLSKHMGKQSASHMLDNRFNERPTPTKRPIVDRPALKVETKPILVDTQCQTEQEAAPQPTPKVAWQDQSPVSSQQRMGLPPDNNFVEGFSQTLGGTAPFSIPQEGLTYTTPFQSTGSATMAQVLAAMQALAQTTISQERESLSRVSRHSPLRRANSNLDYNYSDNFEEPSCVSLTRSAVSPLSRPRSRAASSRLASRSPVKTVPEDDLSDDDISEEEVWRKPSLSSRRSSRNMRYQKRSGSLKASSFVEQDSSSTTSTAASTSIPLRRSKSSKSNSKKSQTSIGSLSTSRLTKRSHSSNSNVSTSKACQTPAPARSLSTQTDAISDSEGSVQTVLPSPTRDLHSDHVISSHSSLESGSIYIGSDCDTEEEEEDPLKLSYLLSTESVQFSDEEHPTSLLKLCSPSEARAVNKFMYTF